MKVVEVEQTDLINNIEDNIIVFNKETQSYFKKDVSVSLSSDTTFRDAILGAYKEWSRFLETEEESDFTKYYDNKDEIRILRKFNMLDEAKSLISNRLNGYDTITIFDTITKDIKSDFLNNRITIDLTQYNKVIYLDAVNGIDTNDATENNPVKTIRRAESLIIDNSVIVIAPGLYDITFNNTNSDTRYCESGLAGKNNLSVSYYNPNNTNDVLFVVDRTNIDDETRDLTFVNSIKNDNVKIVNCSFKMVDNYNETTYGVSIARSSEGISFIDCVFDMNIKNGNITYNKLTNQKSIRFINCIININKTLNGPTYDVPYAGKYELVDSFINDNIRSKIENYDAKPKDMRGEVSLIENLSTRFFS